MYIVQTFFLYDPVLLLLGAAGFIYAGVKREIFVLLWIVPFLVFLSAIGYIQYFYWIPVLPIFCIAAARLIDRAATVNQKLPFAAVAGLAIFGLVFTTLLVTTNVTSAQFEAAAFAAGYDTDEVTIISSPAYSWIFIYVFDREHSLTDYRDLLFQPLETEKILLVSDQHFQYNIGAGKQLIGRNRCQRRQPRCGRLAADAQGGNQGQERAQRMLHEAGFRNVRFESLASDPEQRRDQHWSRR